MACMDRTREFHQIMSSLGSGGNKASNGPVNKKPIANGHLRNEIEFTRAAQSTSKRITATFAKLEKLTQLAKKQTLFENREPEIQELTFIIKQDMQALTQQILNLQQLSDAQKSAKNNQIQRHSQNMVTGLGSKLGKMKSKFENLLKSHFEQLKKQELHRKQFLGSSSNTNEDIENFSSNKSSSNVEQQTKPSRLMRDEMEALKQHYKKSQQQTVSKDNTNKDVVIPINGHQYDPIMEQEIQLQHRLQEHHQQQDDLLLTQQDDSMSYLESRASTMSVIESTLHELSQIFQQLASLVREQEEAVQRIDTNVEMTESHVAAAHSELVKYLQSVSSNKWLMAKVGGIVVIFIIIFVILFA